MHRLRPIGLRTADQTEVLFRQLHELRDEASDCLEVDLSCVFFVRPDGMLTIINAARLWHRWTQKPLILTNIHPEVHKYFERVDLFSVGREWLVTSQILRDYDRYARSPASRTLLEVMPIASNSLLLSVDVHRAYERADAILRCWFPNRDSSVQRLCKMLVEIAENIGHSQDQGFVCIQRYDGTIRPHPGSEIVIAVADLGIGIEQSLARRGIHPPMDVGRKAQGSDYISYALRQGVSSREEVAGLGLWRVQQIVDAWRGEFVIRSAGSMVRFAQGTYIVEDGLSSTPGVQVTITVRDP